MSTASAGAVLARTLKALGISQAELARRTGLTAKHVNQVIKHDAPISPAVAAAIGEATGIPAEVWAVLDAIHCVQRLAAHDPGGMSADGTNTDQPGG